MTCAFYVTLFAFALAVLLISPIVSTVSLLTQSVCGSLVISYRYKTASLPFNYNMEILRLIFITAVPISVVSWRRTSAFSNVGTEMFMDGEDSELWSVSSTSRRYLPPFKAPKRQLCHERRKRNTPHFVGLSWRPDELLQTHTTPALYAL